MEYYRWLGQVANLQCIFEFVKESVAKRKGIQSQCSNMCPQWLQAKKDKEFLFKTKL
jgi:hypothetical protein